MNRDLSLNSLNLNDEELDILHHIALKSYEISEDSLLIFFPDLKKYSAEVISQVFQKCNSNNLLINTDLWGEEYIASDHLLLLSIPCSHKLRKKLTKIQAIENEDEAQPSQHRKAALKRNLLFALCFNKTEYEYLESRLLPHPPPEIIDFYAKILPLDQYVKRIRNIHPQLIRICLDHQYYQRLSGLIPISENSDYFHKIRSLCAQKYRKEICYFDEHSPLFTRNTKRYTEKNVIKEYEKQYNRALAALSENHIKKALSHFKKGLQLEGKTHFPFQPIYGIWYFITLYSLPSEEVISLFEIIRKPIIPSKHLQNKLWVPVVAHFFNDQEGVRQGMKEIENELSKSSPLDRIIYIIICYLTNSQPEIQLTHALNDLIIGCFESGYQNLALEAAYSLFKTTSDPRSEELYHTIAGIMKAEAALVHIKHDEAWVKNFKIIETALAKTRQIPEKPVKINYFFNKELRQLQLIIQNKTEKGWSKGRKISHKEIPVLDNNTASPRDQRIIEKLKRHAHCSEDNIFELIPEIFNHPNTFINEKCSTPALFTPGRLKLKVIKSEEQYLINCIAAPSGKNQCIEEVAPNIFRIYTISEQNRKIFEIINQNRLTFPQSHIAELKNILYQLQAMQFEIETDLI